MCAPAADPGRHPGPDGEPQHQRPGAGGSARPCEFGSRTLGSTCKRTGPGLGRDLTLLPCWRTGNRVQLLPEGQGALQGASAAAGAAVPQRHLTAAKLAEIRGGAANAARASKGRQDVANGVIAPHVGNIGWCPTEEQKAECFLTHQTRRQRSVPWQEQAQHQAEPHSWQHKGGAVTGCEVARPECCEYCCTHAPCKYIRKAEPVL